jgi:hypothetical protein
MSTSYWRYEVLLPRQFNDGHHISSRFATVYWELIYNVALRLTLWSVKAVSELP